MTQESGTPALDRAGEKLVTASLTKIIDALGLKEQTGPDGDAVLPVNGVGGPLDGQRIGEFRVYTRSDGITLIYSRLSIEAFAMDTHQVYGFTASDSPIPHLFIDTAISPNTEGTFHFGLDLVPRVDLGANLAYSLDVYAPLDEIRADALARPGVMPVPSIGPLQWSIRSPWMVPAIVLPADLLALSDVTDAYVDRWLELVNGAMDPEVAAEAASQHVAIRDTRNREAMFSPQTNPVWGLLDKLVGAETAGRMKDLLIGRTAV
jgi:hypothetical protein